MYGRVKTNMHGLLFGPTRVFIVKSTWFSVVLLNNMRKVS